jgi:hypothetical protein
MKTHALSHTSLVLAPEHYAKIKTPNEKSSKQEGKETQELSGPEFQLFMKHGRVPGIGGDLRWMVCELGCLRKYH